MRVIFIEKKFLKKISTVVLLLVLAVVSSVIINNNGTSVFFKQDRKLPIYSVSTNDKKIAISFDTSWGTDTTNKILNTLDKYNVKATFFVVARWAEDYSEETKEIAKRGHEIANHSDKHPNMTKLSKEKIIEEIASADAKILTITGIKPKLFRCPAGEYNDLVVQTVEETNHKCIQWDVDSIDWKEQGAEVEYKRVIDKVKPGSIILFHNNAKFTPSNLPKLIEKLKSDGYEFVKISDLIYGDNYYINQQGIQIKK